MPQVVDFETLVCGGGGGVTDGKIVCETTLPGPVDGDIPGDHLPPAYDPEQPPESFWLPVEDVKGWVDRSAAAVYDRDDSTKEATNPKSQQHHHPHHNPNIKVHSSSQRYAAKAKAHIIGLPNKLQHSGYLGNSSRRHAANVRIFPKKISGDGRRGKSAVPETEPSSPQVSCFGRVLSDRDRNRRRKVHGEGRPSGVSREISHGSTAPAGSRKRSGFLAAIIAFSCCRQDKRSSATIDDEDLPPPGTGTSTTMFKVTPSEAAAGDAGPAAPGLGGLKRFASGRRPASWGGDLELDGEFVTQSGPLQGMVKQQGKGILARRSAGTLEDLDCDGDCESGGPASV